MLICREVKLFPMSQMSHFFQLHSISKTVASAETPPKEKYVRSILYYIQQQVSSFIDNLDYLLTNYFQHVYSPARSFVMLYFVPIMC